MPKLKKRPPKRVGKTGGSFKDITGQKQTPPGRLKAVEFVGRSGRDSWWRCRCTCGRFKLVRLACFRSLTTKSCGCLRRELARANGRKARRQDVAEMVRFRRMGFHYQAIANMFGLKSWTRVWELINRWCKENNQGKGRRVR